MIFDLFRKSAVSSRDIADLLETVDTPCGRARRVRPAAWLSETPARWLRPSVPLGTHESAWPARTAG